MASGAEIDTPRRSTGRLLHLYRTTVGKKIVMATTGVILLLFVVGHMVGNLKIYTGQKHFDDYAEGLRTMGAPLFAETQLLWMARTVLLAALVLHVVAAVQLARLSWAARPTPYHRREHLAFSYASYTMRWGGITILAFVIYHLMHLTWGNAHSRFVTGKVYHNVVTGFQSLPVSLAYIAAMLVLGLHLYHGLWSAFQTLGINNPGYNKWRRPFALSLASIIVLGNISIPLAVLMGIVK